MVHFSVDSPACFPPVHLTLLVPELIWPEPGDRHTFGQHPTPGFDWLSAQGRFERSPRQAFENVLAGQFGLPSAPFGALRLLGETATTEVGDHCWLCADPVHLRFHHERIILADAGAFELAQEEADEIIDALNREFSDVGLFYSPDPRRWYLRLNATVDEKFPAISEMAGRRLDGELEGKNTPLTRWLNEVQMFLHGLPVNARRQASGKPAINSLWLWGTGHAPRLAGTYFQSVTADNPLARGLGKAAAIVQPENAANLTDWLQNAPGSGNHLVVIDHLLGPVLYEDGEGWRQAAQALDQHWLQALRRALGSRLASATVIAPTVYGELRWSVQPGDRWRFWRKGRNPQATATALAEGKL